MRINQSDVLTDDLVRFKSATPVKTFTTPLEVWLTNNTDADPANNLSAAVQARLDCPSGRVWFTDNVDGSEKRGTKAVILPADGSHVSLYITGEGKSLVANDAIIRAVEPPSPSAPRPTVYGTRPATVFWFDEPKLYIQANSETYIVENDLFTSRSGIATTVSGRTVIKPSGLNLDSPQISSLRLSLEQTLVGGSFRLQWDYGDVTWEDSAASGTSVQCPLNLTKSITLTNKCDSAQEDWVPLYGRSNGEYENFIAGGATRFESRDTPFLQVRDIEYPLQNGSGIKVATATFRYSSGSADLKLIFNDFAVVYDTIASSVTTEWLRQGSWSLDAQDGSFSRTQKDSEDVAVTARPVETGPTANTLIRAVVEVRSTTQNTLIKR